jgi:putative PIN family toxin of toxin-antitoxin system
VKAVFDTNIYVSAFAIPGGAAERAMRMAIEGAFDLAISRPILDELLAVLARKFAREPEQLARTAIYLSSLAELVVPTERVHVLPEDADNRILECASAAGADFIVTGDQEILSLRAWRGIEIVSLRQFLERFGHEAMQSRAAYRVALRVDDGRAANLSGHDLAFLAKLLKKRHGIRQGI